MGILQEAIRSEISKIEDRAPEPTPGRSALTERIESNGTQEETEGGNVAVAKIPPPAPPGGENRPEIPTR